MNRAWYLLIVLIAIVAVACQSEATPTATKAGEEIADSSSDAEAEEPADEPEVEEVAPESEVEEVAPESEVEEVAPESEVEPAEETAPESSDSGVSFDLYGGTSMDQFKTTDSGLQYYFSEEGDGQVAEDGQFLMVNFVGWLEDGTEFANTAGSGGPVPLPIGSSTGLIGLDEALIYLSTGSASRIVIPAELMVDENGGPSRLPPGNVAFEMEVVEIIDGPPGAPESVDEDDYTVTDSGLMIYDFEEGDGSEVVPGQIVAVNYTGWLVDDTVFDSSVGRQPISLVVGAGEVIQGWDEGLQGMKLGGRRQLVIPAELAYGDSGSGSIPPNSVLIFEVEMVEISDGPPEAPQTVDEGDFTVTNSGLKFYDFEEGSGPEIVPFSQVLVDYTGWLEDGAMFDSSIGKQPFSVVVGTGSVIQGWDEGLQGMKLGGRRQLVIPAELAYGESGSGPIPPNAVLIFEVEIVDVQ